MKLTGLLMFERKSSDLRKIILDFLEFCGIVTNSLKSLKKKGDFHLSSVQILPLIKNNYIRVSQLCTVIPLRYILCL